MHFSSKNFNEVKSTVNENENWRAAASGSLNKAGYAVSSFWAFDFSGLNPKTGSAEFNIPSVEENPAGQTDATTFMKYMGRWNLTLPEVFLCHSVIRVYHYLHLLICK